MAAAQKIIRVRILRPTQPLGAIVSWVCAIVLAFGWSGWPILSVGIATLRLAPISQEAIQSVNEQTRLELQRSIQKHYLQYGVYLPLEDIMFTDRILRTNKELTGAVQRFCQGAPVALWLPIVIRLPFIGERSTEWCWKPKTIS